MDTKPPPYIPVTTRISKVDCEVAFNTLGQLKEKLYAYYFTRASWFGSKICYFQRSYESPALFFILQKIFIEESYDQIIEKLKSNKFSEQEIEQLITYICNFFENCGNYNSFGDTKFIPEIPKEKFQQFIKLSEAYKKNQCKFEFIWEQINLEIYAYHNPYFSIDMINHDGLSGYYSPDITSDEAKKIKEFMEKQKISPINSRLIKTSKKSFEILIASASKYAQKTETQLTFNHEDLVISLKYGDFAPFLQQVNDNLCKCLNYSENQTQKDMLLAYIDHFNSGDIEMHKMSQRHWIKNKGPIIETNIGFVESYLDPLKVRAEFEGFVAVVNKKESEILNSLVEKAEVFTMYLPWDNVFNVDKFKRPDFTSLDVLTFATSGTPVGINLPNYDEIRQNDGFKNVNLGNAYGKPTKENIQYTSESDKELFYKYYKESLFITVALHELLGHGTGKLFSKNPDSTFNFEYNKFKHPFKEGNVVQYYDVNQTWHSVFGEISGGYEECRADGVALYLSCFDDVLDLLLPEYKNNKQAQEDIAYMAWFDIVYSAIKGLIYYDPEQKKWGQAHITAGFALFQVMLRAGQDFVKIEQTKNNDKDYLLIHLDRSKIKTVGKKALGDFLNRLMVYKSTADAKEGTKFFESYIGVDDQLLGFRKIVLENRLPRRIEMQDDVTLIGLDEDVQYAKFEENKKGLILSHIHHFQKNVDDVFEEWLKTYKIFRYSKDQQKN